MASNTDHTLVFHHGALGDTVLIWPLLRGLSPCTLVASWAKARLSERWLEGVAGADGEGPALGRLFGELAPDEADAQVRSLLGRARRIVSFVSNGHDAWAANVAALAPQARLFFASGHPPQGSGIHIGQFHLRQLSGQGLEVETTLPPRRLNPDGPVVVLPGAGSPAKCWPLDRFDELLEHLEAIGRPVVVLLGEAEQQMSPAMLKSWAATHEVVQVQDLEELAQHIARASVVVGNDSGPIHLAAQLGIGTVVCFGPTDPRIWGPIGPAVRILAPRQPEPMTWLAPEVVAEAVAGIHH